MRQRLLIAVAAVLALGALIDTTLHRDSVGLQICCESEAEKAPLNERTVITLALGSLPSENLPVQLRLRAPGATLLVDGEVDEPIGGFDTYELRTTGAVADIRTVDLGDIALPGPPDVIDIRQERWTMRLAPGPVGAMVVVQQGGVSHLIDVRLLEDPPVAAETVPIPASEVTFARGPDRTPTMTRAILGETVVLLVLMLAGGLLLPRRALSRPLRAVLAPLVGIALHASLGLLMLPGLFGLSATVGVAALLGVFARARGTEVGWRRDDLGVTVGVATVVALTVALARVQQFLFLTADSRNYWAGGAALADGTLRLDSLSVKRGITLQSLHAPGFVVGAEGLQALGAVVLVVGVLILFVVGSNSAVARDQMRLRYVVPALVGLAVLLSTQVRSLAAFLNSHVLVAVLLLALVILVGVAGSITGTDPNGRSTPAARDLIPAVTVVIAALVLVRGEGALLVGLVLLGTLTMAQHTVPASMTATHRGTAIVTVGRSIPWRPPWVALGIAALVWASLLTRSSEAQGEGVPWVLVILAATGVAALAVAGAIGRLPTRFVRSLPVVAGIALWVAFAVLVRLDDVVFIENVVLNIGAGHGGWGVSGPLLLLAGTLAVVLSAVHSDSTEPWLSPAKWFVIGFIPLLLLVGLADGLQVAGRDLERLLRGAGQQGPIGSVNRMWMHGVFVAALLFIGVGRAQAAEPPSSTRRTGRRSAGAALVALSGVWIALQWQPAYLPTPAETEQTLVHEVRGEQALTNPGGLLDGVEVAQSLFLRSPDLPEGARPTAVCAVVSFVTFDRQTFGSVTVQVRARGIEGERIIDARRVRDWSDERVCLDIPPTADFTQADEQLDALLTDLSVSVRGSDAEVGSAISILQGTGGSLGAIVTWTDLNGAVVQRRVDPLALTVDVRYQRPVPWGWPLIDQVALVLPWVMVVLGVGAVAAPTRRSGAERSSRERTVA